MWNDPIKSKRETNSQNLIVNNPTVEVWNWKNKKNNLKKLGKTTEFHDSDHLNGMTQ
jgi:ligand-binding SRPBCC domain-containing protein